MKKLLLIGAMLIVGATSFSETLIKLNEDTDNKYTGEGVMGVSSSGKILDTTGKVILIVTPSSTTGASHTALSFDFGKMTKNDTSIKQSDFTAQVLNNGVPVELLKDAGSGKMVSAVEAEIVDGELQSLKNESNQEIGSIRYGLSQMSDLSGDKLTYNGKVIAEVVTGRTTDGSPITGTEGKGTPTGRFSHTASSVKVTIDSIKLK